MKDGFYRQVDCELKQLDPDQYKQFFANRAFLVFKPETLRSRCVVAILDFVNTHGFKVHSIEAINFHRHQVPLLWSHDLFNATEQWLDWLDQLYSDETGLLVALTDVSQSKTDSATRLAKLKPLIRNFASECVFGSTSTYSSKSTLFNFVHSAQNRQEYQRELAIFMGSRQRRQFIKRIACDQPDPHYAALVEQTYRCCKPADFDSQAVSVALKKDQELSAALSKNRLMEIWFNLKHHDQSAYKKWQILILGARYLSVSDATPRIVRRLVDESRNLAEHSAQTALHGRYANDSLKSAMAIHDVSLRTGQRWLARQHQCDWLNRITLSLLKPEAFATRSCETILQRMYDHGFKVVAIQKITFSRLLMRLLWIHRMHSSCSVRLDTIDYLGTFPPVIAIALEDTRWVNDKSQSASERLNALKGHGDPERRQKHELRWDLPCSNRLLNFVHCSANSKSVIRELAVLFNTIQRKHFVAQLCRRIDLRLEVNSALRQLYRLHQTNPLTIQSVEENLAQTGSLLPIVFSKLIRGDMASWWDYLDQFDQASLPVNTWDLVLPGAITSNYMSSELVVNTSACLKR